MRNTLRGAKIERRRFEFVMMATVLAGFWSLMSGTFFLMTLRAAGRAGLSVVSIYAKVSANRRPLGHGDLRTRRAGA